MPREMGLHQKPQATKKQISAAALVLIDLLCIGLGLVVFALFHHVIAYYAPASPADAVVLVTPAPAVTPGLAPAVSPDLPDVTTPPEGEASPPPVEETPDPKDWRVKFADQFTDGEVIQTDTSFRSANVSVTLTRVEQEGLVYQVADVYVSELKYLRSAFGGGSYGSRAYLANAAAANQAIAAISGDHFYARTEGVVVRNGVLYRETRFEDLCILLSDGRMLTISDAELDLDALKEAAPWQVWSFGPKLLDKGQPITEFTSTVRRANPRSAIGYVEPGHYYLVQVDGRGGFGSQGMSLAELSQLFADLGCETAYNLDGGQTSGFAWMGRLISYPYDRMVFDLIYVTDSVDETAASTEG